MKATNYFLLLQVFFVDVFLLFSFFFAPVQPRIKLNDHFWRRIRRDVVEQRVTSSPWWWRRCGSSIHTLISLIFSSPPRDCDKDRLSQVALSCWTCSSNVKMYKTKLSVFTRRSLDQCMCFDADHTAAHRIHTHTRWMNERSDWMIKTERNDVIDLWLITHLSSFF